MERNFITAWELSLLLDITKSSMYYIMHPDKKETVALKKAQKENRPLGKKDFVLNLSNYSKDKKFTCIDIDEFLFEHKIAGTKFKGDSFLDRLERETLSDNDYPDQLTTKLALELTDLTVNNLKKLRENNLIEFTITENNLYASTSKNRFQYSYCKDSLLNYCKENNILIKSKGTYKFTKQFYSPKEVQEIILNKFDKKVSISTIYRRVITTKEIPAIRIGSMIKVPIIEFEELDLREIFKIVK